MAYDDKASNAVYALNSYVWKLVEANIGWTKAQYQGATPVIPSSQQPEFMALGGPFLVYTSVMNPTQDLWAVDNETIAYNIFSKSTTECDKIVNLLYDTFKRADRSAADVNQWIDTAKAGGKTSGSKLSFMSIRTTMAEKSNPKDEESGYYNAVVMLSTRYVTREDSGIVTTGFTYP